MGLLEDLKRQAGAVKAHQSVQRRDFGESVLQVDDAMHRRYVTLAPSAPT